MMSLFRNFFFQLNNNIFIFFTDLLIPKKGKLTKNGFVNIKKVIEDNDAIRFINYIETNNISLANNNEDILIPEVEFLSKICFHVNIIEHVKSYLGSDYCLDVVEIIKTSPSNLARSSLWHHDGVGHRLKLYIILKDNLGDNQIKTEYINSSNNIRRLNFSNTKIFEHLLKANLYIKIRIFLTKKRLYPSPVVKPYPRPLIRQYLFGTLKREATKVPQITGLAV